MDQREVKKVASLARLSLTDQEIEELGTQLTRILGYMDTLSEVDTDGAAPMPHAVEVRNVFRSDERRESLPRDAALSNAPQTDGQFFLVPPILDQKDA